MMDGTFPATGIVAKLKEIDHYNPATEEGGGKIMFSYIDLYVNAAGDLITYSSDPELVDENPSWLREYTHVCNAGHYFEFPYGSLTEFGIEGGRLWIGDNANDPATDADFAVLAGDPAADFFRRSLEPYDFGFGHCIAAPTNQTVYEMLADDIISTARRDPAAVVSPSDYIDVACREWKYAYGDSEEVEELRSQWEKEALRRFADAAGIYSNYPDENTFCAAMRERWCSDLPFIDFGLEVVPATLEFAEMWRALTRSVQEIIALSGLRRCDVADVCCIPPRTLDNWTSGVSNASLRDRLYMQTCLGVYTRPVVATKGYHIDDVDFFALIGRKKWCDLVDADDGTWYVDLFAPYSDDPISDETLHEIAESISSDEETSARHRPTHYEVYTALLAISRFS